MNKNHVTNTFEKLKYLPKVFTSISFLSLFVLIYLLFLGRKNESFRVEYFLEFMPHFYQHVSNLAISFLFYSGVGYFWLLMGVPFRMVIFLGLAIVVLNLVYELFIPILNTQDIMDAYFGVVGIVLGFLFLLLVRLFGLRANLPKMDDHSSEVN